MKIWINNIKINTKFPSLTDKNVYTDSDGFTAGNQHNYKPIRSYSVQSCCNCVFRFFYLILILTAEIFSIINKKERLSSEIHTCTLCKRIFFNVFFGCMFFLVVSYNNKKKIAVSCFLLLTFKIVPTMLMSSHANTISNLIF